MKYYNITQCNIVDCNIAYDKQVVTGGHGRPKCAGEGLGGLLRPMLVPRFPYSTPNLPTNIVDFGGLDSSTILI